MSLFVLFPYRLGHWLPEDHHLIDEWVKEKIRYVRNNPAESYKPVVQKFKEFIEGDPYILHLFTEMFNEVPLKYQTDPNGDPQVRDYHTMLDLFNLILTTTPEHDPTRPIDVPINAILDWPMGTLSGCAAFLHPQVSAHFHDLLKEWERFLDSEDSREGLWKGWLQLPDLERDYDCDSKLPYFGFKSWNDFFGRQFRDGKRPVADPQDDYVVVNACESAPLQLTYGAKERDTYWIKSQPYSLANMLGTEDSKYFAGGTVYQAYLSALNYHRWHAPVSGIIKKAYVAQGTYYSEALDTGFDPDAPGESQRYVTAVATRALIFIEARNKDIGLMCFVAVGMVEVSSCVLTVSAGQPVEKGDDLGTFHVGGSTHCLVFGPQVQINFDLDNQTPGPSSRTLNVKSKIAVVEKKTQ